MIGLAIQLRGGPNVINATV